MDLSLQTFLWLRDKGGLSSQCGTPSADNPGMMLISSDGLQDIASGLPLVKVLHHYCCHRFDVSEELLPMVPTSASSRGKRHVSVQAARHHNWNVIKQIVVEALQHDIPDDQIQLIQMQGDALEALLVVKCLYELVREHREREKTTKAHHSALVANSNAEDVRKLLETKSAGTSKKVTIGGAGGNPTPSPIRKTQHFKP